MKPKTSLRPPPTVKGAHSYSVHKVEKIGTVNLGSERASAPQRLRWSLRFDTVWQCSSIRKM